MVTIETKIIEKYIEEGVSPEIVAKEHNVPVEAVELVMQVIKEGRHQGRQLVVFH